MSKQGKVARYVIDENQLKAIYEAASEAGVNAYREERERMTKERRKRVLNNAKTLVVNYRRFKEMCDKSVYSKETATEPELEEVIALMNGKFRNEEFEVMSIKEKVVRTKTIMNHVDRMLNVYGKQCSESPDQEVRRRWRVITMLYLISEPYTVSEVAESEYVTESTVYRDCKKAYNELAVLFFGIDGVRF